MKDFTSCNNYYSDMCKVLIIKTKMCFNLMGIPKKKKTSCKTHTGCYDCWELTITLVKIAKFVNTNLQRNKTQSSLTSYFSALMVSLVIENNQVNVPIILHFILTQQNSHIEEMIVLQFSKHCLEKSAFKILALDH